MSLCQSERWCELYWRCLYSSTIATVLHSETGQKWCSLLPGGQKGGLQEKQTQEEWRTGWFFPYYHSQQQKSLAYWHTNQMPRQHGRFLLSRKLIYHYPERLVSSLLQHWSVPMQQRQVWWPGVSWCFCSSRTARCCRVPGSPCLGTSSCGSRNE